MKGYVKVKVGRRWHLCRKTLGAKNSFRSVAAFDSEAELDAIEVVGEPVTPAVVVGVGERKIA